MRIRTFISPRSLVRPGIALLLGLLLGFLAGNIGAGLQNVVPFLLFPLLVGVASAFTVRARNSRPYVSTLGTGLPGWIGVSIALLILAGRSTPTACTATGCGSPNSSVLTSLLVVYVLVGLILTALGALITSAVLKSLRSEQPPPH